MKSNMSKSSEDKANCKLFYLTRVGGVIALFLLLTKGNIQVPEQGKCFYIIENKA